LIPNEEFSIGGSGSVRGYKERILSGDQGFQLNNEIQKFLPAIPLTKLGKKLPPLESHVGLFWDYGRAFVTDPYHDAAALWEDKSYALSSAGIDYTFNIGTYLQGSIDYGLQLKRVRRVDPASDRLHVRVTFTY